MQIMQLGNIGNGRSSDLRCTLLEGLFPEFAARNLDGMAHRQMFTDRSISFLLERIGYAPTAQWIFGQDAADAARMFRHGARKLFPEALAGRCEEALYTDRWEIRKNIPSSLSFLTYRD